MIGTRLDAIRLAPRPEGAPGRHRSLATRLSLLLRRNGRVRAEIGMALRDTPRTADQVLRWGRGWCRRHGASLFVLLAGPKVVGMMTKKADGTEVMTLLAQGNQVKGSHPSNYSSSPRRRGSMAGTQSGVRPKIMAAAAWIPAFAGMTAFFVGTFAFTRLPRLLALPRFSS